MSNPSDHIEDYTFLKKMKKKILKKSENPRFFG
jgi:hypothetical protein